MCILHRISKCIPPPPNYETLRAFILSIDAQYWNFKEMESNCKKVSGSNHNSGGSSGSLSNKNSSNNSNSNNSTVPITTTTPDPSPKTIPTGIATLGRIMLVRRIILLTLRTFPETWP